MDRPTTGAAHRYICSKKKNADRGWWTSRK
jgi:hypothetical protein